MRALLLLIVLEILTVFVFRTLTPKPEIYDSVEYINLANNLEGEGLYYSGSQSTNLDYRLFSKRTLGYPFFLQLQWLNNSVVSALQALLVLFVYFLGLILLRQLSGSNPPVLIYTAAFSTLLAIFCHAGFILSDLLLTVIVTLAVLVFYSKTIKEKNWSLSILWTIGLLIKPVLLPTLILIPLVLIFKFIKNKFSALWFVLPILAFASVSYINRCNTGQFEYSSISTINLAQYNAKLTIAKTYGFDSAQQFSKSIFHKLPENKEEYAQYKTEATLLGKSAILENFGDYLYVHTLGSVKMILDPGRFELFTLAGVSTSQLSLTEMIFSGNTKEVVTSMKEQPLIISLFVIFISLRILLLFGLFASVTEFKKHWMLWLVLVYFLAISGPVGAARFFLPVSVVFVVLSALGWSKILAFFKKSPKS